MMPPSFISKVILSAFILAALFGVYGMVSLSHDEHGGCPMSPIQHTLCGSPLEHLSHWQAVFTAVFAEIFTIVSLAAGCLVAVALVMDALVGRPLGQQERIPLRPPLLQELFSQGILHRKEPQVA